MSGGDRCRRLHATDIVGARVQAADGRRLGSVVDLVLAPRDPTTVTHLLVGGSTFLGRFSVLRGKGRRPLGPLGADSAVRLEDVVRLEPGLVVVKPSPGGDRDRP
ncbi:MAG TPA: PRC-barrel domain-containing protein [Candidatus Limnocylindrales bacterium]|nr:PRC-barrel domain-containing protein [Candidatus Limnocylindrales bacterium]